MTKQKSLPDNAYPCNATLHIKDGKAVIILHEMFGLEPGTTIPLLREEHNLTVQLTGSDPIGILNGHVII